MLYNYNSWWLSGRRHLNALTGVSWLVAPPWNVSVITGFYQRHFIPASIYSFEVDVHSLGNTFGISVNINEQ